MVHEFNNAAKPASVSVEPARLAVQGEMTFATVAALYDSSIANVSNGTGPLSIDLVDVERADSAGIALIVEWYRLAKVAGRPVNLMNLPDQVTRLIKVSGLQDFLR